MPSIFRRWEGISESPPPCSSGPEKRPVFASRLKTTERVSRNLRSTIFSTLIFPQNIKARFNGTGLGLFIAHQNMKDHGGTIEVNSKVDKGTTFILTLPVNSPNREREAS